MKKAKKKKKKLKKTNLKAKIPGYYLTVQYYY